MNFSKPCNESFETGSFESHFSDNFSTVNRIKRIVQGSESSIEKFPYTVSIKVTFENSTNGTCSGAILSESHVITAAHCVNWKLPLSSYEVRAGSSHCDRNGSVHTVLSLNIHKKYNDSNIFKGYDIALIRLKNPIYLDNRTKKAVTIFKAGRKIRRGNIATLTGWGASSSNSSTPNQLQSIDLGIVSKKYCSRVWSKLRRNLICANSLNDAIGSACYGDSGGPLVIDNKLAGISSFIDGNCTSYPYPNVFEKVSYNWKWIDKMMKLVRLSVITDQVKNYS